jgi:hypothetical protein
MRLQDRIAPYILEPLPLYCSLLHSHGFPQSYHWQRPHFALPESAEPKGWTGNRLLYWLGMHLACV